MLPPRRQPLDSERLCCKLKALRDEWRDPSPTRRSRAHARHRRRGQRTILTPAPVKWTTRLRREVLETQETLLAVTGWLGRSFILQVHRPEERCTSMSHKNTCYLWYSY